MTDRLEELLHDITRGYRNAHADLHGLTQPPATGRRTPPGPRQPSATAVPIRRALIHCARFLVDANLTAGGPTRPPWPGFQRIGWRTHIAPRTWWNRTTAVVQIDPDHPVYRWAPDAADLILTPPSPHQTKQAALWLSQQAAGLQDQGQHDAIVALLQAANGAVRHAGGHTTPTTRICVVDWCRTPIHAQGLCRSCYDKLQAEKRRQRRTAPTSL